MPPSEGRNAISAYSSTGIIPRDSSFRDPVTVPTDWIVESCVVFHGDVTFSPGVRADDNVTCMQTAKVEDWVTFGAKARLGLPTLATTSSSVRERNSVKVYTQEADCSWERIPESWDP